MKKNQLGTSDLFVSEMGLGCMTLGTDTEQGIRMIHEALDQGINFLDTADLYDYGKNEEIVGQSIKGRRDRVILATKVGNRWNETKDGWFWDPSKAYIKEQVKRSLKRLSTDYIDLYQLHGGTIEDPIEETINAFEELTKEGLIRYYGISSIRPNVIREYVKRSRIVSVMTQYSILDRRPEEEILPLLKKHQISVIARGPLAQGLLTERVLNGSKPREFLDYTYPEIQQLVRQLQTLADETRQVSHLALQYALAHPAVATIIPGASKLSQLKENAAANRIKPLSEEELMKIRNWSKANFYQVHR